jgi:hypothetical protein
MLAAARYRVLNRRLPENSLLTSTQLQDTYRITQLEATKMIKNAWEHDVADKTIVNCWKHTGILGTFLTRQGASTGFEEDFGLQSREIE